MRRGLAAAALLALLAVLRPAFAEAACEIHFRVTPRYDSTPRSLEVELAFPAEGRSETMLRVQPGWAGVEDFASALRSWRGVSDATSVEAADVPYRFRVVHPPGGEVRVAYRAEASLADPDADRPQAPTELYRTQIGSDWFQFFGYGVFPSLEPQGDDRRARLCVSIEQPGASEAWTFGSGLAQHGGEATRRFTGSPFLLRHAFYGGGAGWRISERQLTSGTIYLAARGKFGAGDEAIADQAAALIDMQRRFWGNEAATPQWLVVTPNHGQGTVGTLVEQVAALQVPAGFTPSSPTFEFLIGHENQHQWIPRRLGGLPKVRSAESYWLSEGFTNYYTHRLLLASGLWDQSRYADELTRALRAYWRSPARNASAASIAPRFFSDRDAGQQMYARGEMLAMRWDLALRRRGSAGIDEVLRQLLLPAETSGEPTLSAVDRLFDALEPSLGTQPPQDVLHFLAEGQDLPLPEDVAGPCFALRWNDVPRWVLGFDQGSIAKRSAAGVVVDGPAYRAGLRDGMPLLGWSIWGGDVARDVELTVKDEAETKKLRYRPSDGSSERLPTVEARPQAAIDAECKAWIRAAAASLAAAPAPAAGGGAPALVR